MSPLTLRRFRAERLLKREFEGLRSRVIETARRRLLGTGVDLDICDLEACYALAWQGLYGAVLEGQEIDNPAGWLVLVTFRRAIEEHRARGRAHRGGDRPPSKVGQAWGEGGECGEGGAYSAPAPELDLAAELDDRLRLRHLFEGLSARMSTREREAAVLCYLQGLPRAQAAARLGVSERRMRKLMEGQGPGRPGVAGKMGALVETIRAGDWCEEQGSLMRGLAFGVLDPEGERYRLALLHRGECPACRHYVASLRGLAALLPPLLLRGGLSATALPHLGAPKAGGGLTHAPGSGTVTQLGGTTISASGAAGAGGAGGGWLLASGSLSAKLAAGCLLALGVGAGCVALEDVPKPSLKAHVHRHPARAATSHLLAASSNGSLPALGAAPQSTVSVTAHARAGQPSASHLNPTAKATQEFGPEQPPAANTAHTSAASGGQAAVAHVASASPGGSEFAGAATAPTTSAPASTSQAKATREFSPG
jgi:DNA-directed RNA polymerase specialized sigma24 family protein